MNLPQRQAWREPQTLARRASALSSVAGVWSLLVSFVVLRELSQSLQPRSWP
jgi:hypothetical protein